jgi:tRNA nucleotidyltransferase (CCA-adding enzyme)
MVNFLWVIEMDINVPKEIKESIPNQLKGNIKIVGGWVRDNLLDREPNDIDYVVHGVDVNKVKPLMEKEVGNSNFPVFLDKFGNEVAMARKESKSGSGYKGFEIEFGKHISLEEDLYRRDLTISSVAVDPFTEKIVDPFNGIDDIKNKKLTHVSNHFQDDPVRSIRLCRYGARFPEFSVDNKTIKLSQNIVHELNSVPNERIGMEFKKAMNQAQKPRRFFEMMMQTKALQVVTPEIARLKNISAGSDKHHKESDCFEHTMMVLQEMYKLRGNDFKSLMMAVCHDVGKWKTRHKSNDGGHDKKGIDIVKKVANNLRLKNSIKQAMVDATKQHIRVHELLNMKESKVLRFVQNQNRGNKPGTDLLLDLIKADKRGRIPKVTVDNTERKSLIKTASEVLQDVDGNTVKQRFPDKTGKAFGQVLEQERARELKQRR